MQIKVNIILGTIQRKKLSCSRELLSILSYIQSYIQSLFILSFALHLQLKTDGSPRSACTLIPLLLRLIYARQSLRGSNLFCFNRNLLANASALVLLTLDSSVCLRVLGIITSARELANSRETGSFPPDSKTRTYLHPPGWKPPFRCLDTTHSKKREAV